MANKTVAEEIQHDFEELFGENYLNTASAEYLKEGLKEILEKHLGQTKVLYDTEGLAEKMACDTTFGWVDEEPHHNLCACGPCLDRAANEKE